MQNTWPKFGYPNPGLQSAPLLKAGGRRAFVCAQYTPSVSVDRFVKERLSFVEIAFRDKEKEIAKINADLPGQIAQAEHDAKYPPPRRITIPGDPVTGVKARNRLLNEAFQNSVTELNERLRRSGAKLHYHNGFIQISDDQLVQDQIENPFWALVKDQKWENVDVDMKEAIDRRDGADRDPAFYSAKALESTIKIISGDKGWTNGKEKGAHNFIDHLTSNKFVESWEGESLKHFFTKVRNPLGHGPGGEKMPELTPQQTDLAIEFCMSWIKSLVRRLTP